MKKTINNCTYMILKNVDSFKELEKEIYQLVCSIVREKIKKVEELKKYLLNHWEELQNYHNRDLGLPEDMKGMGAIESNIDKVLADTFKKRGMRWSK